MAHPETTTTARPDAEGVSHGEEYLLAGEFARLVEKTPATVRGWADTGRVQVLRTQTGVRLFRRSDVARFVK